MDTLTLTSPGDPTSPGAARTSQTAWPTPTAPGPATPPVRRPRNGRAQRLWRGADSDPAWARPALLVLLLATGVLYTWNLTSSGYANSFYSAAVQAGSESWKAFFFGSSDAANSITVDKPPASLWVMALSVRLLVSMGPAGSGKERDGAVRTAAARRRKRRSRSARRSRCRGRCARRSG